MRWILHVAAIVMSASSCGAPDDVQRGDPFGGPADPTRAEGLSAAGTGSDDTHASSDDASGSDGTARPHDIGESGSEGSESAGTFSPLDDDSGGAAPQPADGWWSPCLSATHCDPGLACLGTDAMTDGVCTAQCVPYGDARSCADSPGGSAETTCLTVGGQSICALDCEGGRSCPSGMVCLADSDDLGPIAICM